MPYPKQQRHAGPLIYLFTFPNGKRYVGQTTGFFEVRMNKHKSSSKNREDGGCVKLNCAIRKHGWDSIKREILVYCDKEQLDEYEHKMISTYNTLDPHGYNLMVGGNSNKSMSDSMKSKASVSHIRNSRKKKPDRVSYGCIFEHKARKAGSKIQFAILDHPLCEFEDFNTIDDAVDRLGELNIEATSQNIDVSEYDISDDLEDSAVNTFAEIRDVLYGIVTEVADKYRKEDRWKRIKNAEESDDKFGNKPNAPAQVEQETTKPRFKKKTMPVKAPT